MCKLPACHSFLVIRSAVTVLQGWNSSDLHFISQHIQSAYMKFVAQQEKKIKIIAGPSLSDNCEKVKKKKSHAGFVIAPKPQNI